MASKNLAQDESIEVALDPQRTSSVAITTRAGNDAGANFVLEAQIDNEWVTPCTMINPLADPKEEVAALTGASKAGWADLPGFRKARVRRTDANAGAGWVEISAKEM